MKLQTTATGLCLLAATLAAQDPSGPGDARLAGLDWMAPIHTLADDPVLGPYGTWASGPDFKASFHDGFVFFPLLGRDAPAHTPVAWQTLRVEAAGRTVLDAAAAPPRHLHGPWHYEYRFDGIVERYDVRREGVEQSFVLGDRPGTGGDVVVVGRIRSDLRGERYADADGTARLVFRDAAGAAVVEYGAAMAFDADGRVTPVATEWAGDEVRLVVRGDWAARARWPVTIDPLISRVPLPAPSPGGLGGIEQTDIGVTGGRERRNVMVAASRFFTATDLDNYALVTDGDFGPLFLVFTDIAAGLSSRRPAVAYVQDAGRWVIVFEREAGGAANVRVWLHDASSTTLNSGSMMFLGLSAPNTRDRRPDVGGSTGSWPVALVVYEAESTSTLVKDTVRYVFVDAAARIFSGSQALATSSGRGVVRNSPRVTQFSDATDPTLTPLPTWAAVWQERDETGADPSWKIHGQRITFGLGNGQSSELAPARSVQPGYRAEPDVSGVDGRFAVSYLNADAPSSGFGARLTLRRFDWRSAWATPALEWIAVPVTGLPTTLAGRPVPRISGDQITSSHWTVTYLQVDPLGGGRLEMLRVGYNGATVESQALYSSRANVARAQAVTFDARQARFLFSYEVLGDSVYGQVLTYPTGAGATLYGTGCGGQIGSNHTPLRGSELWQCSLAAPVGSAPAALLLSLSPAAIDLGFLQMGGCFLNVDPALLIQVPAQIGPTGFASQRIALPVPGDIYLQWLYVDTGATPLGLATTEGLWVRIR